MKGYSKYFWIVHFSGDLVLINLSYLLSYYYKFNTLHFSDKYIVLLIFFNLIWILTAFLLKLYALNRIRRLDFVLYNLFKAAVINVLLIIALLFSLKVTVYSREHLSITYLLLFFMVFFCRIKGVNLCTCTAWKNYYYKKFKKPKKPFHPL